MNKFLYKTSFTLLLLFLLIWNISNVNAWSCEYKWKIDQCIEAQNWNTKSIEDFVCITWNKEEITYQVILDMEFKKIDKKMDKYMENLENNKSTYFWVWASKTYIDAVNDIHDIWNQFKADFFELCSDTIITKVLSCSASKKTTIVEWLKYFLYEWSSCKKLAEKKVSIFKDVSFSVLMLNKMQISADDKKLYDQWQRSNYDHLLDIMMINLWYIERIWQKWPSKLANPM